MLRLLPLLLLLGALLPATASGAVVINEVNCQGEDWVELANTSKKRVDVSGWVLTDVELPRPRAGHRYVFPAGRSIAGKGLLTVDRQSARRRGLPFGIACGTDTLRLARSAKATATVDEVVVGRLTATSDTYGRLRSGTGAFRQTAPTRGGANQRSAVPDPLQGDNSYLFDPTTVHEMALTLPQASSDALASATKESPKRYVPASFSLTTPGASSGPYEVGVRLKGDSTYRTPPGKAAFKIKFDHAVKGQRFHGLKTLTLNNLLGDRSMVRETVAYEAIRAVGVPASRAGYAFVTVNGAAYGVYANVETVDQTMLHRWPTWFASTRHLFESDGGADVIPERVGDFEVDKGDPADLGELQALVGALANTATPYSQRMAPVGDLTQLTHYWAVERYVGQIDGYTTQRTPRNFFLHSDDRGVFRMLPWGMDKSLGDRLPYGPVEGRGGRLFDACIEEPACKQRYLDAVADVRRRLAGMRLETRVDQLTAVLRPWRERDPHRPFDGIAQEEVARTRAFLAQRPLDHVWTESADGQDVGDAGLSPQP